MSQIGVIGCAVILMVAAGSATAIEHSGVCSGVFSASDNPHVITSSCTIPAGSTLLVEPGVEVVGSTLFADGTLSASQVVFEGVNVRVRSGGSAVIDQSTFDGGSLEFQDGSSGSLTGSDYTSRFCLNIDDASPTVQANTITQTETGSSSDGICIDSTSAPAQPLIDGNTILGTRSEGIVVTGTAQPTVTNNQITVVRGTGIEFRDTSGGEASGNVVDFVADEVDARIGLALREETSALVQGNTIADDVFRTEIGLEVEVEASSTVQVTGNEVSCSGTDVPLRIGADVLAGSFTGDVSGNTFTCGLAGRLELGTGTPSDDVTLGAFLGETRYLLSTSLTVPAGQMLTVEPGVELVGSSLSVDGTLSATQATFGDVIVNVRSGGSALIDQSTFNGGSLQFRGGSSGSVTGSSYTSTSCLRIDDASPTIQGNTITQTQMNTNSGGICIDSASAPAQPLIDGNAILGTWSEGIVVTGTAEPTVTNNQITVVRGTGIEFRDTSGGEASGNVVDFVADEVDARIGLALREETSALVQGNTIADDVFRMERSLVVAVSSASTVRVLGNDVGCSGEDTPLEVSPAVLADAFGGSVSGNSFTCGVTTIVLSGNSSFDSETALSGAAGATTFELLGEVGVAAGQTLTVEPGITVRPKTNNGATLIVEGTLVATGAILTVEGFTTGPLVRVAAGGDLQLDSSTVIGGTLGAAVSYEPGSAGAVRSSRFGPGDVGLAIQGASPMLADNLFAELGTAVSLSGTTNVAMTANAFQANGTAIEISGDDALSVQTGNEFTANTDSLAFADDEALVSSFPADFADTSVFSGGPTSNLIRLPAFLAVSGVLPTAPVAYRNTGDFEIRTGAQLVVQAGTVVASEFGRSFEVEPGGRLLVQGSSSFPVVFTDIDPKDANRWDGLVIRGGTSVLEHCVVEFSRLDGVRLENASIDVDGCRISDNLGDGIELIGDSAPLVTGSTVVNNVADGVDANLSQVPVLPVELALNSIFGNGALGVRNQLDPAVFIVDAERNYWGSDDGPSDLSDDRATGGLFNPTGQGQGVGDGVDYDPWIRLGPSIAGTLTVVSGQDQTGMVGELLPEPIVVEISSALGSPLEGIEVIFSVVEGDAVVVGPQPLLTDADGRIQAQVQLGATPGEIVIAATARDVDSPLAAFLGEADAPCLVAMTASAPMGLDSDGDGIEDEIDNCLEAPNPGQRDTDGDGYGNYCDADLNGDGVTDFLDLGILKSRFFTADPDADLDGDGSVDFLDLGRLKEMFLSPPGP